MKRTIVVKYHPLERHWYRVADFVQTIWHRFSSARSGALLLRLLGITLRVLYVFMMAVVIVGSAVLYIFLSFALGNGKLAKSIGAANK